MQIYHIFPNPPNFFNNKKQIITHSAIFFHTSKAPNQSAPARPSCPLAGNCGEYLFVARRYYRNEFAEPTYGDKKPHLSIAR